VSLEQLWAGWRGTYVAGAGESATAEECVLCRVIDELDGEAAEQRLHAGERVVALLNAFPYNNGHLLVLPRRHVPDLTDLDADETAELWATVTDAVAAVRTAYEPGGLNVGLNLGRGGGAGIPDHLHVHVLPRWAGDTTFTTTIAGTRVIPESLAVSGERLRAAWPSQRR
jgi:ATP adenylyltransferase